MSCALFFAGLSLGFSVILGVRLFLQWRKELQEKFFYEYQRWLIDQEDQQAAEALIWERKEARYKKSVPSKPSAESGGEG